MSLTLVGGRRARDEAEMPILLEFHSPSSALTVVPALYSARGVTWMVSALAASCIAAAGLIPIDKVVTADGRIVATEATTVVQPLDTAIVRSIDVHEGDKVKAGQLLAQLDPTFAKADAGSLEAQVASLQAEVDRLQAEATGKEYHPTDASAFSVLQGAMFLQRKSERAYKNENYVQKISSLQTQVQGALMDAKAYAERLKVATLVESKRRELERLQVGSQLNLLAATDTRLEIKQGLDSAAAKAAQATRDLQALKAEQDAYNQNWFSQVGQNLTDQGRKLSDARGNLKKAMLRQQLVQLRADQDSTVLSVAKVSPGSVMQSGEQLITLVPTGAPLEAEVNIPGDEAGYVHPGDPVTVKLATLPYAHYGMFEATVRTVSPDSFSISQDNSQSKQPAGSASAPATAPSLSGLYYRARIALGDSRLHDVPTDFHMVPGMPVTADVKVGKRTILTYLFSRVLPTFMDGMREP